MRDWRAAHPERRAAYNERNRQRRELPEVRARHAFSQRLRHARIRGAAGRFTPAQWAEKIGLFAGCCAYCGRSDRSLTVDHVVAIALGGDNSVGNIVPACMPCNRAKGVKSTAEFLAEVA